MYCVYECWSRVSRSLVENKDACNSLTFFARSRVSVKFVCCVPFKRKKLLFKHSRLNIEFREEQRGIISIMESKRVLDELYRKPMQNRHAYIYIYIYIYSDCILLFIHHFNIFDNFRCKICKVSKTVCSTISFYPTLEKALNILAESADSHP